MHMDMDIDVDMDMGMEMDMNMDGQGYGHGHDDVDMDMDMDMDMDTDTYENRHAHGHRHRKNIDTHLSMTISRGLVSLLYKERCFVRNQQNEIKPDRSDLDNSREAENPEFCTRNTAKF
jgi:hypothetical protein